jgi:hypothetical protein
MDILSISFSIAFNIKLNLSSEDQDVDGFAYPLGFLSPLLNICVVFPDAIIFSSTLITLLNITSIFVDLLSLNSKEKSLSKDSAYRNYASPGDGWTFAGIEL